MDYEKAYKNALERARKMYHAAKVLEYEQDIKDYEEIFPELAESEDERIRKEIIDFLWKEKIFLQEVHSSVENNPKYRFVMDAIAWLEKQKSADKVEPKFKVGDWIVNRGHSYLIADIDTKEGRYLFEIGGYTHEQLNWEYIKNADKKYHLWTIQDAKPGDVLTSIGFHTNCTFVFKGLDTWNLDEPNGDRAVATGYCCLSASADKMEFGIQGPDCIEVNAVKPATKIQRDLLFSKMKEAGYEWDADKKELKIIDFSKHVKYEPNCPSITEEKPAWSEDDERLRKTTIAFLKDFAEQGIVSKLQSLIKEWELHDSSEAKYRLEAYKELLEFIKE